MTDTKRQWKIDGIIRNGRDAQQMVQTYRAEHSLRRAKWLVENALTHGHPEECNKIFTDALAELQW